MERSDKEDRLIRDIAAALARYWDEPVGMNVIHHAAMMVTECGPLNGQDQQGLTLRQFKVEEFKGGHAVPSAEGS